MLTVRLADPTDGPACAAIYDPIVRDTIISLEYKPPGPAGMTARLTEILTAYPWLVAERGGEVIGYAYAGPHRTRAGYAWAADFTVYIAEKARRQGVGRRLYEALIPLVRRQGYFSAFAGVTLPNAGSKAVHEAVGFYYQFKYDKSGFKFGAWHDVGWWRLELAEGLPQHNPIPFPELCGDPLVRAVLG